MTLQSTSMTVSSIAVLDTATELLELEALTLNDILSIVPSYADYKKSGYQYDAEARLPLKDLLTLWRKVEETTSLSIGFEIGRKVNEHKKGLLASWVSQAQTLGDALLIFINHNSLLNPLEKWEIQEKADTAELILKTNEQASYPNSAIIRSMVSLVAWGQALCRRHFKVDIFELTLKEVDFPNWMMNWCEHYQLSSDCNRLVISKTILAYPIPNHNPYLENLIEPVAKQVLQNLNAESYSASVLSCISQDINRFSDIQAVCKELHVSRSTLFRRLKLEETSFTKLLSKAREKRYHQLKNQNAKIINIALELGFKDTSALYKATRNW